VEEMESDEWDLTLFTCTIGGKSRVTIRCERVQ
jgi:sortase A